MKIAWRILKIVIPVVAVLAILAPYIPAAFLRGRVEYALSSSLDRPVSIGDIRFTFFPAGPVPGPGFTLDNVTIHEDPRAGIEPFAHMTELGASIRILSLLRGRLELSGINLDEASINIVKTNEGTWNFQMLLERLKEHDVPLPALRMRGGRVDFKFGDTKSVFFFNEADLDVSPTSYGSIDLRFSGAPSRSDHTKQDFGRFFIRGNWTESNQLDLRVEVQRSSLEEILRTIDPQGFGVHGELAMNAHVAGPARELKVDGKIELGDVHRWDLLPDGHSITLPISGTLNLRTETAVLVAANPPAFIMNVRVRNYLSHPELSANAGLQAMPLAAWVQTARHMGAMVPENLVVSGAVSGNVVYNSANGLTGSLVAAEPSFKLPDSEAVTAPEATLAFRNEAVVLTPTAITMKPAGIAQIAQVEGSATLTYPHTLDLRITSRGINAHATQSFGLPPLPLANGAAEGIWRGAVRLREGEWTSDVPGKQLK